MAGFMVLIGYAVDAIKGMVARPPNGRDALLILEDLDKCRNLHKSVAIVSFFVAAGLALLTFFAINDLIAWLGVSKQIAAALIALSWVLIFPIWALFFLLIMSVLYAIGIRDVRSLVTSSLSKLTLSRDQLRELDKVLASRHWRHGQIFKSVVADLSKEQPGF